MFDQVDPVGDRHLEVGYALLLATTTGPSPLPLVFFGEGEAMPFAECPALTAFEAQLTAVVGANAVTDFYSDVSQRPGAAQVYISLTNDQLTCIMFQNILTNE